MLIGSWSTLRGQVTGSFPVKGCVPNSTSATPSPSEPGSQEATSASMFVSIAGGRIIGRPETTRTTHRAAWAHTVFTAFASASESCMVLGGRSTPWSSGSKPHRGPPTSPNPSEYGVSPTTTIPVAWCGIGADASWL